ncbi:TPA: hypothetical protein ACS7W1_001512 [Providencia alcalifaciens]
MIEKLDFDSFYEKMTHEIDGCSFELFLHGYRVDNNGIKKVCNCSSLKSVDYLFKSENYYLMLEFSDLIRQHSTSLERIKSLQECNLDRDYKKRLIKEEHKKITQELRDKFLSTSTIIDQINMFFTSIPEQIKTAKKNIIIVIAPIVDNLYLDSADIIRLLDRWKNSLITSIPDSLLPRLNIIDIHQFHLSHPQS